MPNDTQTSIDLVEFHDKEYTDLVNAFTVALHQFEHDEFTNDEIREAVEDAISIHLGV